MLGGAGGAISRNLKKRRCEAQRFVGQASSQGYPAAHAQTIRGATDLGSESHAFGFGKALPLQDAFAKRLSCGRRVAAADQCCGGPGRPGGFQKKESGPAEPIRAKTDSYVLETNVHFPTDLNLLWDA